MQLTRFLITVSSLVAALGCVGNIDDAGRPPGRAVTNPRASVAGARATTTPRRDDGPAAAIAPAATSDALVQRTPGLRRLTRREYANTVKDMLGADVDVAALPQDPSAERLSNNANLAKIGYGDLESFVALTQKLSEQTAAGLVTQLPCKAPDISATCVRDFLSHFLLRAFRRPVDDAEITEYAGFFTNPGDAADAKERLRRVVQAALLSPAFMYRTELGDGAGRNPGKLRPYEVASKLSYLVWQSMPDEPLFASAASGSLATAQGRSAELDRMLKGPRGHAGLVGFALEWLGLTSVMLDGKHPTVLKNVPVTILADMNKETARFVEYVLFESTGTLRELLAADFSFPTGAVRDVYGLPRSGAFEKLSLPRTERRGLLTQSLTIAAHAKEIGESPIQLGKFIREFVMCQDVPPPLADVKADLPEASAATKNLTLRERFKMHSAEGVCAGCHQLFDPPGFAFSPYDPIGRYKATDAAGRPYDTTGTLVGLDGDSRPFTSAVDMIDLLAASRTVSDCFTQQLYRWQWGRVEGNSDQHTLNAAKQAFFAGGTSVVDGLKRLVATDDFVAVKGSLP